MEKQTLKNIIEAILMTADKPKDVRELEAMFEADTDRPTRDEIRHALSALQEDYEGRGLALKEVASGYRFQVAEQYAPWVSRLWEEKPPRYSRALLETLALVAYRQPITRGEIEEIRGVSVSSHILKTLLEREWVRVLGHKDVPGKPAMYGTTREFLDYFNMKSLDELPSLAEIKDLDKIHPELALDSDEFEAANDASENHSSEDTPDVSVDAEPEQAVDNDQDQAEKPADEPDMTQSEDEEAEIQAS
ncbi:MAG TPA: SMC-Scp complex subunit ScpB [Gammaproteobacteria bacterium]